MVDRAAGHEAGFAGTTPVIQGFEKTEADRESERTWQPVSDRKIRVGIVGYGVCGFGAAFHFQDHPNVTVTAVADMVADKCAALAKACRCGKQYASGEDLIRDDTIEAVLLDRTPLVDVAQALNMTVAGIVAHQSALRDGELMKVPQYVL